MTDVWGVRRTTGDDDNGVEILKLKWVIWWKNNLDKFCF